MEWRLWLSNTHLNKMGMPYADGISVVAPKVLIVPPIASQTSFTISGQIFLSGSHLWYMSGQSIAKIEAING